MTGAVFSSCLFGLRHLNIEACRLLGGSRWCLPKWQPLGELLLMNIPCGLCHQCPCLLQWATADFLLPQLTLKYSQVYLAQAPMESLLCLAAQCMWKKPHVHPPRVESVSAQSCGALIPKLHWPSKPNVILMLMSLMRVSEVSLLWEIFCNIIIF